MNAPLGLKKPSRYEIALGRGHVPLLVPEFTFRSRPMTKEETETFVQLHMSTKPDAVLGETGVEEFENEFLVKIIKKRFEVYKLPFKMTDKFLLMSMMTFAQNPGKIMILLRLCWQKYVENGTKLFDLLVWAQEVFPWGVPTEQELEAMWDSQKAKDQPYGNLIDNPDIWRNADEPDDK